MGRPLNKKYFGNTNSPKIGGEGVASVTIAGEFSGFTGATTTVTFSAPQLPTGVTATGTATIVDSAVTAIVITNAGSGYTAVPTVTIADSDVGAEVTTGTATAVLTTSKANAISMTGYLTGGSAVAVDIIRQVSTRRYKVTDGTRTGIVTLSSTEADAAGEGSILATDASGGTYYVTKLTAHKATLKRGTGTVYTDGAAVPWTFGTATATTCKIANA